MNELDCSTICDMIASGDLDTEEALKAFEIALEDDPTESNHAAHIRDAIRDNFPDTTI